MAINEAGMWIADYTPGHKLGEIGVVNGQPSERIFIIARNMRYVIEWCRIHDVNPGSRNVKYVTGAQHLRGVDHAYYVDLGTNDIYLRDLIELLASRGWLKPLSVPKI